MIYAPLPEWELITKRKELPKWWYEIESVSIESEAERAKKVTNKYTGLSGTQAVLCCLKEANGSLKFRQIVKAIDRQETSVANWLHQLLRRSKITYEERDHTRYWRPLRHGETPPSLDGIVRYGPIQRPLVALLKANPEHWFTPGELVPQMGSIRVAKIIQALQSLVRAGEVDCRPDSAKRRHPYQYRWSNTG